MRAGLRHSGSRTPGWLAGALRSGGTGRHAPGRGPVGRTGWRNARRGPCLSAAAKALPVLAGRLGLELPPPRAVPDPAAAPAVPDGDIPGTVARRLDGPGPVPPGPVGGAADRRRWEAMVERHHPLGWARPPGGRVRQWIRPERHGVPGGIGFGPATWRLAARDRWIGWTPGARAASTGRVVRSHRFLLLPGVRVYGLASEVPPMAAARVAEDREARYPVRPVAACTHVGPEHSGHGHHRAGWTCAGRGGGRRAAAGTVRVLAPGTAGAGRCTGQGGGRSGRRAGPVTARTSTGRSAGTGAPPMTFGRIRRRVTGMGRAWLENMGGELPAVLPAEAAKRAAYRPLPDPGVTMEHIPGPHSGATAGRCRRGPLVPGMQDTTTLNHPSLEATGGLADPGGGGKRGSGVPAHAGLAVTAEGRPPGPRAMDADLRDAPEDDSRRWTGGPGRAREPAAARADTRVVSVRGRGGGFRRLPGRAAGRGDAPPVRPGRSGRRRVRTPDGGEMCLRERAAALPAPAVPEPAIPASGGPGARKGRVARPGIRAAEVTVMPPGEEEGRAEPPRWLPLASGRPQPGVADAVHAAQVPGRYRGRWTVETWFRTPGPAPGSGTAGPAPPTARAGAPPPAPSPPGPRRRPDHARARAPGDARDRCLSGGGH